MKKLLIRPLSIVLIVGTLALGAEYFFMLFDEKFARWFNLSENELEFLDAVTITLAIVPALYFLIFRRMSRNEEELVQAIKLLAREKNETIKEKLWDEALLASLGEGMVAVDNSGIVTTVNHRAEQMLGWTSGEIVGKNFVDVVSATNKNGEIVIAKERAMSKVLAKIATNGPKPLHSHPVSEPMYYIRKNGKKLPISITITPIILNDKIIGAVEIFYDTTKENEIEKTRGDLLALASHQLRTPLSGTKWLIETLMRGIHGPLTSPQVEYLSELYKINERMTSLVSDMLGVIRMENNTIPVNKRRVSTTEIINAFLENFSQIAKDKHLTISVEKDAEYIVETDPLLLRNILDCLISNAVNYSNDDGAVLLGLEKVKNKLVFSVKDSGIGIPNDEQKKLFERFFRASNAKIFNTKGTGLGLYIASLLAEKIGAKLSFESKEGKGSTFYVHIPLRTQAEGSLHA